MSPTTTGHAPAGARNAILPWIRLGGRLVIYATDAAATLASLGIG